MQVKGKMRETQWEGVKVEKGKELQQQQFKENGQE